MRRLTRIRVAVTVLWVATTVPAVVALTGVMTGHPGLFVTGISVAVAAVLLATAYLGTRAP